PTPEVIDAVADLERFVVTGQIPPRHRIGSNADADHRARVTLRLRVRESSARDYRRLEAIFLRHRPPPTGGATFLRFLCAVFVDTWRPRRETGAYASIYERDGYRC